MGAAFNRVLDGGCCSRKFGDPNATAHHYVGYDAFDLVDAGRGAEVAERWRKVAREVL